MTARIALYIVLIALFYAYCSEDTSSRQLRGPNDVNRIEVPQEMYPEYQNHTQAKYMANHDSLQHWLSTYNPEIDPHIDLTDNPSQKVFINPATIHKFLLN